MVRSGLDDKTVILLSQGKWWVVTEIQRRCIIKVLLGPIWKHWIFILFQTILIPDISHNIIIFHLYQTLGVMFDLMNKGQHHVDYIAGKGNKWVSRLNSDSYLSRQDAWCSYMYQLEPSLAYLIKTLSADPTKVKKYSKTSILEAYLD